MWKGKYRSTENKKIGKERGNFYQKNEEISGWKAHWTLNDTFQQSLWWCFSITLTWRHIFCAFTYIYSLLIEKDICDDETFHLSFHAFVSAFYPEISSFFQKEFPLYFPIFLCKISMNTDATSWGSNILYSSYIN